MCGIFTKGLPEDIGDPMQWCKVGGLTAYAKGSCDSFLIACPAVRKACPHTSEHPSKAEWCAYGENMTPRKISDKEACC